MSQPDTGEQALDVVDTFIRSASVDVVCVDSVAALVPKAELEGAMTEPHMALQARLMSKALRKISHSLAKSGTLLVFLNQVRQKINMGGFSYGITEYTSGGTALKYYSSVRMEIRKIGSIKRDNEIVHFIKAVSERVRAGRMLMREVKEVSVDNTPNPIGIYELFVVQ